MTIKDAKEYIDKLENGPDEPDEPDYETFEKDLNTLLAKYKLDDLSQLPPDALAETILTCMVKMREKIHEILKSLDGI
jgi:hypothetical protein